jgi:hypothetical protein
LPCLPWSVSFERVLETFVPEPFCQALVPLLAF